MYIRTKDGVYEVEGRKFYDALKRKHYITTKGLAIKEDDIIKQSENLEELCDELIVYVIKQNEDYEKIEMPIIAITRNLTSLIKIANATNSGVLGAIWTSTGLIYVARMDNEGKLQLL